jgi:UPF0042 nucleotide-binding protein
VTSFGFKYGPQEASWVFDARFLDNPFWIEELRPLSGLDQPVHDHVWQQPAAREFVERITSLLSWAVPLRSPASGVTAIAVGCTGGRHRSVVVATHLAEALRAAGMDVELAHRDVSRPSPRIPEA